MSSTSLAGSREHKNDASVAGQAATYHNKAYSSSHYDFDRCSAPHVRTAPSLSATSSLDRTNQHDIVVSSYSRHQPYLVPGSSSLSGAPYSSSAVGFSGTRPSHAVSTVDKTYHGNATGAAYSSGHSSSTGGHATRTSRRDDYDRLPLSGLHHSSNAAFPHSTTSHGVASDRYRRHH